jgi:hypothetical protein
VTVTFGGEPVVEAPKGLSQFGWVKQSEKSNQSARFLPVESVMTPLSSDASYAPRPSLWIASLDRSSNVNVEFVPGSG